MALKDWKKVKRSFIVPEGIYYGNPIVYEYKKYVRVGTAVINPALVIYKTYNGKYACYVYAPKGSFKKFGIKQFGKTFNTKTEALKYAKLYMKKH